MTPGLKESDMINSVRQQAIGGFRKLSRPRTLGIPEKTKKALKKADISVDEFLAMLVYAKHLPRGKRELKLNFKELRDQLVSEVQSDEAYLTQVSGLQLGGKMAQQASTKPLSQTAHIYNIKNKNRKQSKPVPYVDYPNFKNGFILK
tara:strand:- start:3013 stop:3453 length:441 start_codon:yes stop_codon:yes gene_type:complete